MDYEFEFDPEKSAANKIKHGIDFFEAQKLWSDEQLTVIDSRYAEETRSLAIGKIDNKCWVAVFMDRQDKIRLISVRRARRSEEVIYESSRL